MDTSTVEPAGRQEGQHIAAAAIHQEGNEREQSPLGNSTVLGSLGSKESNLLGVRIMLGKAKSRSFRLDSNGVARRATLVASFNYLPVVVTVYTDY